MKKYNIKELEEKLKICKDIDLSEVNIDEVDDLDKIKISTINNEVLDEIRKLLIERRPTISQLSSSPDEKNEDVNSSKQKVIKFPKRRVD